MTKLKKPIFINFNLVFQAIYTVLFVITMYSVLVGFFDITPELFFDYAVTYTMYAVLIMGIFTASAWVCLNVLVEKMGGFLSNIKSFKFDSVIVVWDLYFDAWSTYTTYTGFILALLLFLEHIIVK